MIPVHFEGVAHVFNEIPCLFESVSTRLLGHFFGIDHRNLVFPFRAAELRNIEGERAVRGRVAWKSFRELVKPIWSQAFTSKIQSETFAVQVTNLGHLVVSQIGSLTVGGGDRFATSRQPPLFHNAPSVSPSRISSKPQKSKTNRAQSWPCNNKWGVAT